MKTLVIAAHPALKDSVINKRWLSELQKYPDQYTIHVLADVYPDGCIDAVREQHLVETHGSLIFQFPFYWFSCPPILKAWFDTVLTHGWAYGRNGGDKLAGRKIALAVSTGIRAEDYDRGGRYHYTLAELLAPFETMLRIYCRADYRPFFVFYGAEDVPGEDYSSPAWEVEASAQAYARFAAVLS
ncbi:MAG: NAD(P)H-dependent oxidoreductase [Selenomonas artemidis]